MAAVILKGTTSAVDLKRCIGCGLCVPTCTEKAIHLVRKDSETVPPETDQDLFDTILADKKTLSGRMKNSLLKTFLRVVTRLSK